MRVLGIETSCDETGAAVYCSTSGLLAHALHSQAAVHADYGGVVPELASRDHIRKLIPLIERVLDEAELRRSQIDAVAYTKGPGLIGALLVGASVGRALAWGWGVPAIGVHHMEGHLLSALLETPTPQFPFVALLVSGGHTQLVHVAEIGSYRLLGQSLDDAVGEAFDKTAKLLGLGYPGGPELERTARQGDPRRFTFPRPMVNRPGLDFSFSGLKTFALNTLAQAPDQPQAKADIARAFEDAVVDTLTIKCRRALRETGLHTLVVAGGVGANQALRESLRQMAEREAAGVYFPRLAFCTDNGAMIAFAGLQRVQASINEPLMFETRARWPMEALEPLID